MNGKGSSRRGMTKAEQKRFDEGWQVAFGRRRRPTKSGNRSDDYPQRRKGDGHAG